MDMSNVSAHAGCGTEERCCCIQVPIWGPDDNLDGTEDVVAAARKPQLGHGGAVGQRALVILKLINDHFNDLWDGESRHCAQASG